MHYFTQIAAINIDMLVFLWFLLHPFHVSVCEVIYDQDAQSIQMTHHLYLDDLEKGLQDFSGKETLDITKLSESMQESLEAYLRSKFKVKLNEQSVNYIYLGSEVEDDVLWCYMEITDVVSLPTISLTNELLTEVYDDQKNIVHFKILGDKKSYILDQAEIHATYQK